MYADFPPPNWRWLPNISPYACLFVFCPTDRGETNLWSLLCRPAPPPAATLQPERALPPSPPQLLQLHRGASSDPTGLAQDSEPAPSCTRFNSSPPARSLAIDEMARACSEEASHSAAARPPRRAHTFCRPQLRKVNVPVARGTNLKEEAASCSEQTYPDYCRVTSAEIKLPVSPSQLSLSALRSAQCRLSANNKNAKTSKSSKQPFKACTPTREASSQSHAASLPSAPPERSAESVQPACLLDW